uniref:Neurotransmitter-gated ion-channel ligand-binding domain-containing protein n=1 Tax=Timema poppense TaxID=170557 RepID=A0A7R9D4D7_TIMPO|nr:unnamed protein product [Timema poppensis]
MQRWCFSLLVIIRVSQVIKALGGSCPADPHPVSSATVRLKNDKFCNYDTMMRPVTDVSRTTTVKVFLWLKHLDFEWKDELLQWNPEDYEGVGELQLISSSIWVPDIALYSILGLNPEPQAQRSDTLPLDRQVTCFTTDLLELWVDAANTRSSFCSLHTE